MFKQQESLIKCLLLHFVSNMAKRDVFITQLDHGSSIQEHFAFLSLQTERHEYQEPMLHRKSRSIDLPLQNRSWPWLSSWRSGYGGNYIQPQSPQAKMRMHMGLSLIYSIFSLRFISLLRNENSHFSVAPRGIRILQCPQLPPQHFHDLYVIVCTQLHSPISRHYLFYKVHYPQQLTSSLFPEETRTFFASGLYIWFSF